MPTVVAGRIHLVDDTPATSVSLDDQANTTLQT